MSAQQSHHNSNEQICISNAPTGSTQVFKIKAKLRIDTISKLKDLIIHDDAACNTAPPPPPPKKVSKVK